MIILCESCSKKFIVKDSDIPKAGRMVQCGYCSITWHQIPISVQPKTIKQARINEPVAKINENLSVDAIKASDGKTYKFLGSQWAVLLPSGKTGLFARRKIGKELDKLTGRKRESATEKRKKRTKKEVDPSSESLVNEKQLPVIHESKRGLGFFGYIFLLIIIGFSIVGILRTFENDLLNYFPKTEFIYRLLDKQLEYLAETIKNMIIIINDLVDFY
tara:strand:- start:359 stop:1009 length:651 start_codon:yes stop_codon:yes gene_type:complete